MAFTTTDGDTSGASAMRVEQSRELLGLKAICAYRDKSENTVRASSESRVCPLPRLTDNGSLMNVLSGNGG